MRWKTKITEMHGCDYPIIQGAFMGFGTAEFAAPVSNAGGFGTITANYNDPEKLREEIKKAKAMTNNPFGVHFTIFPGQMTANYYDDMVKVVIDEGIKNIYTSAYKAKEIGDRLHDAGLNWIHKAATMKHAISAEKHGADAVVIVGLEATGIKNPLTNTTMITMVMANRMLKIPFIACGGIGDARGFLGALAMGAQAVYVGTGFMATKECPLPDKQKFLLVSQSSFDPDLYTEIYHHKLKDTSGGSMAVGVINEIMTVKEYIEKIIEDSEKIIRKWGFKGEVFSTL